MRRRGILSSIFLFVFIVSGCENLASDESQLLRSSLTNEACLRACWLTIQVGLTNQSAVDEILANENLQYELATTVESDDTYRLDITSTENSFQSEISVSIIFDRQGIVEQIALNSVGICPETIEKAFGSPSLAYQEDSFIELLYFDLGIVFFINLRNSQAVELIYIADTPFLREFSEGLTNSGDVWEQITDESYECEEAE